MYLPFCIRSIRANLCFCLSCSTYLPLTIRSCSLKKKEKKKKALHCSNETKPLEQTGRPAACNAPQCREQSTRSTECLPNEEMNRARLTERSVLEMERSRDSPRATHLLGGRATYPGIFFTLEWGSFHLPTLPPCRGATGPRKEKRWMDG